MCALGFMTGGWEWVVIGGVVVLLFFGRRIPEVMRSLGKGVSQFKKGLREGKEELEGGDGGAKKALPTPEDGSAEGRK